MSRVQLALNVADLDQAVDFYRRLFDAKPAKLRPGYANFAIADPPLKLVLIEDRAARTRALNHLGIEVDTATEVATANLRLGGQGMAVTAEGEVTCCHALQDKIWIEGPGQEPWEIYTVLADAPMADGRLRPDAPEGAACCGPGTGSPQSGQAACC